MNHYRKTIKKYNSLKRINDCAFCDANTIKNAVYENNYVYIVPNNIKYDLWELHDVIDHLLIVPKNHVENLNDLSLKERNEIMRLITKYEGEGYNVYMRETGFVKRSIKHQHTHLIKTSNKKPRFSIFVSRPYILIKQ